MWKTQQVQLARNGRGCCVRLHVSPMPTLRRSRFRSPDSAAVESQIATTLGACRPRRPARIRAASSQRKNALPCHRFASTLPGGHISVCEFFQIIDGNLEAPHGFESAQQAALDQGSGKLLWHIQQPSCGSTCTFTMRANSVLASTTTIKMDRDGSRPNSCKMNCPARDNYDCSKRSWARFSRSGYFIDFHSGERINIPIGTIQYAHALRDW